MHAFRKPEINKIRGTLKYSCAIQYLAVKLMSKILYYIILYMLVLSFLCFRCHLSNLAGQQLYRSSIHSARVHLARDLFISYYAYPAFCIALRHHNVLILPIKREKENKHKLQSTDKVSIVWLPKTDAMSDFTSDSWIIITSKPHFSTGIKFARELPPTTVLLKRQLGCFYRGRFSQPPQALFKYYIIYLNLYVLRWIKV